MSIFMAIILCFLILAAEFKLNHTFMLPVNDHKLGTTLGGLKENFPRLRLVIG